MDRRTGHDRPANHGFAYRGHGQNADSFGVSGGSVPLYRRHQGPGPGPDSGRVLVRYRPHRVDLRQQARLSSRFLRTGSTCAPQGPLGVGQAGTYEGADANLLVEYKMNAAGDTDTCTGTKVRFVLRNPEHRPIELRRLRHHLRQRFCRRAGGACSGQVGSACTTGATCQSGVCTGGVCATCPGGTTNCNGTCTSTSTANRNCGACGNACANGTVCTSGACSACTSNCAVGTACTSNSNCASNSCQAGQCVACPGGQTLCGNACVSTQSDNSHCGSCLNVCPVSQTCSERQLRTNAESQAGFACVAEQPVLKPPDCGGGFCCSSSCTDAGGCGTTGSCNSTGVIACTPQAEHHARACGTCNGTGQVQCSRQRARHQLQTTVFYHQRTAAVPTRGRAPRALAARVLTPALAEPLLK